jgi:hypothetical protein
MKGLYIHMHPEAFNGFMSVFNEVNEEGDVFCFLENYQGETIKPDTLIKIMNESSYSVFGVAAHVPSQAKKMKMAIEEEDGHSFLALNIAPFLGLPGEDPLAELKELKGLLEWVKEEVVTHYQAQIYLIISRNRDEVELKIISSSDELESKLQSQFNEKINQSPVLTEWKKNQEDGFRLDNPQCAYLTVRMNMVELLNMTEQMQLMQKRQAEDKTVNKTKFKGFFL